jgi:hypothetical protein
LEERWGICEDQYRLSPVFDDQKSGASYTAVLKIQGGKINPMHDLRPRTRRRGLGQRPADSTVLE